MDARVRHKIRLELVEVNVQGAIETERGRDAANDLSDEAVQVLKIGPWNIQIPTADVVNRFTESDVSTAKEAPGGRRIDLLVH